MNLIIDIIRLDYFKLIFYLVISQSSDHLLWKFDISTKNYAEIFCIIHWLDSLLQQFSRSVELSQSDVVIAKFYPNFPWIFSIQFKRISNKFIAIGTFNLFRMLSKQLNKFKVEIFLLFTCFSTVSFIVKNCLIDCSCIIIHFLLD